jgi:lipid-A-disaccharide synthase
VTRVLVSAGEPSGDDHAAAVARVLARLEPRLDIDAVGGNALRSAGASVIADLDQLSAVGTVEAVGSAGAHIRLLRRLDRRLAAGDYRAVLLVDYPGFNLRLARRAAQHGVPVIYYIAPQLWAWGAWRAATLRATVRHLAVVLPFEETYFRTLDIPCTFVGHPILDQPAAPTRTEARRLLEIDGAEPVLAVFPGRRKLERDRLWKPFRDAGVLLREAVPDLRIVVAAGEGTLAGLSGGRWSEDSATVLAAADVALCKSGTSTLEAALSGTPMVIAYRAHAISYWLAQHLVRVPHIGLVNLVAGRRVVPELLQRAARPASLRDALLPLLDPAGAAAARQMDAFDTIRAELGTPGASQRVAELLLAEAA